MNDSKTSAFGLRAPLCQFLAKNALAQLSDERGQSQLTEIAARADNAAHKYVTRSLGAVQFSTHQARAPIARHSIVWHTQGRTA